MQLYARAVAWLDKQPSNRILPWVVLSQVVGISWSVFASIKWPTPYCIVCCAFSICVVLRTVFEVVRILWGERLDERERIKRDLLRLAMKNERRARITKYLESKHKTDQQ